MAKGSSGCLYIILGFIALGIIIWALKNIVGIAGIALAGWAAYRLFKKQGTGQPKKIEAILVAVGVIIGSSWFAFAPETPQPVENTPPATTESQQTAQQSTYQQKPTTSPKQVTAATSDSQAATTSNPASPIKLLLAKVISVTDGDTILVNINGKEEKVRFIGVDTPETKHPSQPVEPYGPEASAFTTKQLTGKQIYLETDVTERDKYGRLLAYVWTSPPKSINDGEIRSKMFNATLLLGGYAQLMTIPPNVKYVDYFTKYQTEAREAGKGLWGIEVTEAEPEPTPSQTVSTETFVGSANSNKYHYPDCRWAKKISPANLVKFSSSEEARNAGYVPCKVCSPP